MKMTTLVCEPQTLFDAAHYLAQSNRGRNAMKHLLAWLDDDGLALDGRGKNSALILLCGAFAEFPGTARDVMRCELEAATPEVFS
jgi:hypothetical protein